MKSYCELRVFARTGIICESQCKGFCWCLRGWMGAMLTLAEVLYARSELALGSGETNNNYPST